MIWEVDVALKLSEILLHDICKVDLENSPISISELERLKVLIEEMAIERQLAGNALQNIATLINYIVQEYDKYDKKEISKDRLIFDIWKYVKNVDEELEFDIRIVHLKV